MKKDLLEVFMTSLKSWDFCYEVNKDTEEVVVSLFASENKGFHRVKGVYDNIPRGLLSYVKVVNDSVLEIHVF